MPQSLVVDCVGFVVSYVNDVDRYRVVYFRREQRFHLIYNLNNVFIYMRLSPIYPFTFDREL